MTADLWVALCAAVPVGAVGGFIYWDCTKRIRYWERELERAERDLADYRREYSEYVKQAYRKIRADRGEHKRRGDA